MSVQLQLRMPVLREMILRGIQVKLGTTCFSSFPINVAGVADVVYIDHIDVDAANTVVEVTGNAVVLDVPVDVFLVTQSSVIAAPNGTPLGATAPVGQASLTIRLTTAIRSLTNAQGQPEVHQYLDLTTTNIVPKGPLANAPVNWKLLLSQLGFLVSLDLNPILGAVGTPALIAVPAMITLVEGVVVSILFGPPAPPASHLFPGQDWGLFLDGSEVERLVMSRVASALPAGLPFTPTAAWAPSGTKPHVNIDGSVEVGADPVSIGLSAHIGCDLVLAAGPSLRTEAFWSVQVHLGWAIPAAVDKAVREEFEKAIEEWLDPASIGAEPLGYHGLAFATPLPQTAFGGNRLVYATLLAAPTGMTLGGPVQLQTASRATLSVSSAPFGQPTRIQLCSVLAKSGSGAPRTSFTVQDAVLYATINLRDAGRFCAFEPLGIAAGLVPNIVGPAGGTLGAEHVFSFRLPGLVAVNVNKPVRLIVRTARGVRLIDLGVPPKIEVDENGQITNGHDFYLKNCLNIPVGPTDFYGVNWGVDQTLTTNPDPRWDDFVTGAGVDLQLVTLADLEPGELIRFRSRDHAVDVTADSNGRAIVPVILPIDLAEQAPASLIRVNRRAIAGHISVAAVVLQSQAVLPAGEDSVLTPIGTRGALLTTRLQNRTEHYAVGTPGGPTLLRSSDAVPELSRVRAPDTGVDGRGSRQQKKLSEFGRSLPDVNTVMAVPGFSDAPVAVAIAAAGPNLLLDLESDGKPRVAGTFTGPIGDVAFAGRAAIAEHAGRIAIFSVTRSVVQSKG